MPAHRLGAVRVVVEVGRVGPVFRASQEGEVPPPKKKWGRGERRGSGVSKKQVRVGLLVTPGSP